MRPISQCQAVSAVLLFAVACSLPEDSTRHLPVPSPGPFVEAHVREGSFYLRLTPTTPLDAVVPLSLKPLRAGMRLDEARGVAGEPVATRTDAIGTYYSFARPPAMELAHLAYRDSGPVDKWVVVSSLKDYRRSSALCPELQALLTEAGPIKELTIHEHGRPNIQAFSARVDGDRLFDLQWYSIEGIPGG